MCEREYEYIFETYHNLSKFSRARIESETHGILNGLYVWTLAWLLGPGIIGWTGFQQSFISFSSVQRKPHRAKVLIWYYLCPNKILSGPQNEILKIYFRRKISNFLPLVSKYLWVLLIYQKGRIFLGKNIFLNSHFTNRTIFLGWSNEMWNLWKKNHVRRIGFLKNRVLGGDCGIPCNRTFPLFHPSPISSHLGSRPKYLDWRFPVGPRLKF